MATGKGKLSKLGEELSEQPRKRQTAKQEASINRCFILVVMDYEKGKKCISNN